MGTARRADDAGGQHRTHPTRRASTAAGADPAPTPTGRPSERVLALQRLAGNQAVAASLSAPTSPVVQRELPEYQSTDQVLELRPTVRNGEDRNDEVWLMTVEGDFATPAALARMLWPTRDAAPPGVEIIARFSIAVEGTVGGKPALPTPLQRTYFEIRGLAPWTVRSMEKSFASRFTELGLGPEEPAVTTARAAFRKRHDDLGDIVLMNIDRALGRVTMGNPSLLAAYYDFYRDWKLTDDLASDDSHAGATDRTFRRGGFTDLNRGVLHLQPLTQIATDDTLTLLGETLLHEYTHTAHASDLLKGPGEGKAYGVEAFFAERFNDKTRDEEATDLGSRMGDNDAFNTAYYILKRLYEVIDTHRSKMPELQQLTARQAQLLATEFIAHNKADFSSQLTGIVIAVWGRKGYDSLPSQERS